MSGYKLLEQLTAVIIMTMEYPRGLDVLMGKVPPPPAEDIAEMITTCSSSSDLGVRISGGKFSSEAERILMSEESFTGIIDAVGGWEHVNAVIRDWAENYSPTWNIIVDHVRWVQDSYSRVDQSQLRRIATKHCTTIETVCRKKREFPKVLARAILQTPL